MIYHISDGYIAISYGSYKLNSKIPHIIVYESYHMNFIEKFRIS